MKRIILAAFLAISFIGAQAQFGVKGGLNIANLGGDDVDDEGKKALIGAYFGVLYNIMMSDMMSIQPELVYSMQGAKYELSGFKEKLALNYINLTALFRYNNPSGFFAGLGPQFGFLTSAKVKEDGEEDFDIKDQLKGLDIAAAIALGYEMKSGFGFYARFNLGLTSIADEDDVKILNRVFQIGLRYILTGKK